jgi:hypothetical protein
VDAPPVGAAEREPALATGEPVPALVQEPVVMAAEEDEVGELRTPTVGPVLDVVGVDEAMARAAGEPAAAVTGRERTP